MSVLLECDTCKHSFYEPSGETTCYYCLQGDDESDDDESDEYESEDESQEIYDNWIWKQYQEKQLEQNRELCSMCEQDLSCTKFGTCVPCMSFF